MARVFAAAVTLLFGSAALAQSLERGSFASPTPQVGEAAAEAPVPLTRGPVRVGVLVGLVSVPRPLGVELFGRFGDYLGAGVGYSALPSGLGDVALSLAGVSDVTLESAALEGELRLFPFRGSFFVGSAFGRQTLSATAHQSGVTVAADMTTYFVTPRIGWLAVWDSGLSLGLDLGVQLPLSSDITVTSNNSQAASDARSVAKAIGDTPLPSVNLRLGYFL